jgi:hypothetical protein
MNYTKPEVEVLGEAIRLIEHVGKFGGSAENKQLIPAYDLDE